MLAAAATEECQSAEAEQGCGGRLGDDGQGELGYEAVGAVGATESDVGDGHAAGIGYRARLVVPLIPGYDPI